MSSEESIWVLLDDWCKINMCSISSLLMDYRFRVLGWLTKICSDVVVAG